MITIYTDGSALGNPGPGGRGAIVLGWQDDPVELSGYEADSTNNRMELQAVISSLQWLLEQEGVETILPDPDAGVGLFADPEQKVSSATSFEKPVKVFTDSTYVQKGITERMDTWIRRDWRRSKGGQLVKNAELWQQLHYLVSFFDQIERSWVKAHVGDRWNEAVDNLARKSAVDGR